MTPEAQKNAAPPKGSGVGSIVTRKEESDVLGRPGSDLLSQGLSHSTIGAEEFNGRVRDGIGFKLLARTTRPAKDISGIGNQGTGVRQHVIAAVNFVLAFHNP